MAHAKQEQVRWRYNFRCAYCGVSEIDVGGELTVDHYYPLAAEGDESDDNLIYACVRCNQYKGDFHPSAGDLAGGCRVLHPLRDEAARYFRVNDQSGLFEPLNEIGEFHIALLQLNRPALVEHRLREKLLLLLAEKQRWLETENAQLRASIAAQEVYIARLRQILGLS